ncbi:MAG: DUF3800 domain-containing protein [Chloroflexota bacterium]
MTLAYSVYCDESCHLERDRQPAMVLGAVWCPTDKVREVSIRVREIKTRHGLSASMEIKWSKVSPGQCQFYLDVLDYFFDDDDLHFRGLIVPDKTKLRHETFGQTHDEWYYKMYFDLLKVILAPDARYHIYIDIKDSRGSQKVIRLHEVLCNNSYDFQRRIIERVQLVRSHEVEIMQLTDLLTGIISYANRRLGTSSAKRALVARMGQRSGYALTMSTLLRENKVNLLRWQASEGRE